jgi:hypothetical protein
MNADRLIEEWRLQGRVLEVDPLASPVLRAAVAAARPFFFAQCLFGILPCPICLSWQRRSAL